MKTGMFVAGTIVSATVLALLLTPETNHAAPDPGSSTAAGKNPAVTLKTMPGSTVKRITLTAKAAERLGIEMGAVGEASIARKQMVGGLVIPPFDPEPQQVSGLFGGYGQVAALMPQPVAARADSLPADQVWILVTLSRAEWENLATDKPARILPLATRGPFEKEILAQPSAIPPLEDAKRSMLSLHYIVRGEDHGLTLNRRVRVELQQKSDEEKKTVVPYGAVYYDAKGGAWTYLNPEPLTFERHRISIERIEGDLAILSDGPPLGTPVVVTGAAMLYGTEVFGK